MKTNGQISQLLATSVHNEHDYYHRIIYPMLDYLGVPMEARWPQFPIQNPFGEGKLKLDYLIHVNDIPMVVVEGKPTSALFPSGLKQARDYARNFDPAGARIRRMTVPFLLVAAGSKAQMFRAVARGINIEYEPLWGFLEWDELVAEAEGFRLPSAEALEKEAALKAEFATQLFDDLYATIYDVPRLTQKDDQRVILFNQIIRAIAAQEMEQVEELCREAGVSKRATKKLYRTLSVYEDRLERTEFGGAAVAVAYRDFITSNQSRRGLKLFTGETQWRPYYENGWLRYRRTARYFTPIEIIRQMVGLARITADDRVIDFTCGSGGYLAEALMQVAAQHPERAEEFLTEHLVGVDDDPFCVETSKTLLSFLYPDCANDLKVFLHNSLYVEAPSDGEYEEEAEAEPYLEPEQYDVVIGNPPGNKQYSGSNGAHVTRLWQEQYGMSANFWDHVFFVKRAVELAKPEGGRICILVPDGFLANSRFQHLRDVVLAQCEVRVVVSLPRVFKNNNAKMSLLYMVRNGTRERKLPILTASIPVTTTEEDPEKPGAMREVPTNLYAELETVVDRYAEMENGE